MEKNIKKQFKTILDLLKIKFLTLSWKEKIEKNSVPSSEELFEAAENGDKVKVFSFLKAKGDPNLKDKIGRTALHLASEEGHLEVAKLLIENGAETNIEAGGLTALDEAGINGHLEVVKLLIKKEEKNNASDQYDTPLYWASSIGHLNVVKFLLEKGGNANVQDKDGRTALHEASLNDHLTIVKLLIEKGANVNAKDKNNKTPLHEASKGGNFHVAEFLIEKGANIEAQDKQGRTALYNASSTSLNSIDHLETARLLIQKWVNAHASGNYADIVSHLSGSYTPLEVDRILMKHGAKGETFLSIAQKISEFLKNKEHNK